MGSERLLPEEVRNLSQIAEVAMGREAYRRWLVEVSRQGYREGWVECLLAIERHGGELEDGLVREAWLRVARVAGRWSIGGGVRDAM